MFQFPTVADTMATPSLAFGVRVGGGGAALESRGRPAALRWFEDVQERRMP
jgi:glutathione S-transferase